MRSGTINGNVFTYPYLPYALGDELKSVYGGSFKHVVVSSLPGEHIMTHGEKKLFHRGSFIDKEAPEMFTFVMSKGTWNGLDDLHSVMLSSSAALDLFGNDDPLGKSLTIDNSLEVQITGIYEDFPHNSRFYGMDFFAPWDLYVSHNPWIRDQGFGNNFLNIYAEILASTDLVRATERIKDVILDNIQDRPDYVKINPQLQLHPMKRWHLYSEWKNGRSTGGLIKFVWIFGAVGIFVLLLACINFMNLSTARSVKRAKEVGIRKAIGSLRRQLVNQFYTESFLMVVLAFILAVALAFTTLTWFNDLSGKQLSLPFGNPYFWMANVLFILITGIVSASYPALYLSSFNPLKILKGTFRLRGSSSVLRRVLVIVQFTVSVTLIISTIIVFRQIQHVKNRPVGYSRDNLLMIQMTTQEFYDNYRVLETELKNSVVVQEVSMSLSPVTGVWSSNGGFEWRGMDPDWQQGDFATLSVTPDYGRTVGWYFMQGRDFNKDLASDSTAIVINESTAKIMGFENPVGERVKWSYTGIDYRVIGVIEDMIMRSPFSAPMPAVFYQGGNMNWINIKIANGTNVHTALSEIKSVFNKVIPSVPFSYKFADQEYASKFKSEERLGKLSGVFTILAVFISCLGLFGLTAFIAEQRTKEIGIRKVLGASLPSVWKLLSKEFVLLVMVASFMSIPIAYFIINGWLQNYEYRTEMHWEIFAWAVGGALLVAVLTVSFQTIKAALSNPVNSLRTE